jgi:hypothetical protein
MKDSLRPCAHRGTFSNILRKKEKKCQIQINLTCCRGTMKDSQLQLRIAVQYGMQDYLLCLKL